MTIVGKHSLLIVDDEPEILRSLRSLLRMDFEVHCCGDAAEAREVLKTHDIDVIMTDQRMPEMSGVELLTEIRPQYPDAIRMIFTGYADIRAVIDAINQGHIFRYITKPWDPDELRSVLRQAAAEHDALVERKVTLSQAERFTERALEFVGSLAGEPSVLDPERRQTADALRQNGEELQARLAAIS